MSHFVLKTADPQFACTNQMACKIKKEDRILIVGASGMIACQKVLAYKRGYSNLFSPTHETLDFCDHNAVLRYFENNHIDVVIQAAGKVGGIP